MWDFVMEILAPIVMIIAFILIVICFIYLILEIVSRVKETRNNNYICDETKEDDDIDTIQRAIIVIGDGKIEIDVDYYEIDDTTVEIESKDGKVYMTDIKKVLLMSE